MRTSKEKAALLMPEQAAHKKTSEKNHSTHAQRVVVIEKNAFEEIRIGVNAYIGNDYIDIRVYRIRADRSIPTTKGVCIPLALLPDLIEGLTRARDDRYRIAQG